MTHTNSHFDGNALAGKLADLFAVDGTMASIRCPGCGTVALLATAMVYMDEMGTVAHCSQCDAVLLTIVEGPDRVWLTLPGAMAVARQP